MMPKVPGQDGYTSLRKARGKPLMLMSKNELFDLTKSYTLEGAMREAGANADAVLMELTNEEGSLGTTKVARLLRSTDVGSSQTIKASWLVLGIDGEPQYVVIHWNLDYGSVYEMGNWIMTKDAEEANTPVRRVRPRLWLHTQLEETTIPHDGNLDPLQNLNG